MPLIIWVRIRKFQSSTSEIVIYLRIKMMILVIKGPYGGSDLGIKKEDEGELAKRLINFDMQKDLRVMLKCF